MPWKTPSQMRHESAKKAVCGLLALIVTMSLIAALVNPTPRLTDLAAKAWHTYRTSASVFLSDIKRIVDSHRDKPAASPVPGEYSIAAMYHEFLVYFVDEDGLPMRDPFSQKVITGGRYRLQPYVPQGYVVDLPVIEGEMPDHALRFTVTYRYVGLSR